MIGAFRCRQRAYWFDSRRGVSLSRFTSGSVIRVGVLGGAENAASEVTTPYAARQHNATDWVAASCTSLQLKELEELALNEVGLLSSSAEKMREQMVMITIELDKS